MTQQAVEVNFDGLVGPTHNYAGLAYGNIASQTHQQEVSQPREAALQGLRKMKFLMDLGVPQGVLPPQERPDMATLRGLGFTGDDAAVLRRAQQEAPTLLAACCSASSMWAANAATVSPSADTADGRVHFTPANLISHLHRSIETATTGRVLRAIFRDERMFAHHAPLPATALLSDEGAANHMRLCGEYGWPGVEVFVYGKSGQAGGVMPQKFPARQTREAAEAMARLHGLGADGVMLMRQNPLAIDAGVFHNDVIAMSNRNVLVYHSAAYRQWPTVVEELRERFVRRTGSELIAIEVREDEVSLADAVQSYLFNSQLVSLPGGGMTLIAPTECRELTATRVWLERLLERKTPIEAVHFVDTRHSMRNGGGPACLRLRVVLTQAELARVHHGVLLTGALYERLTEWVGRWYRETLTPGELADPELLKESRGALEELSGILGLGGIYGFQQGVAN
jgi:succinylarginine dihydrolase